MDFFAQQDKTRRKTKLLVFYFAIAVAALIVAVYFASLVIFTGVQSQQHHHFGEQPQFALWNPQLFLGVAVGVLAVILIGSTYKTMALAAGRQRGFGNDGRTPRQPEHERSRRTQAAQRRRGNGHRLRRARAAGLCHGRGGRHQRLRRRPQTRRRHRHRHARLHETALPRRIAGRHRPRIQPHFERRHAAEPPAHGNHFWHPLPRHHRPSSFANGARRRARTGTKSSADTRSRC